MMIFPIELQELFRVYILVQILESVYTHIIPYADNVLEHCYYQNGNKSSVKPEFTMSTEDILKYFKTALVSDEYLSELSSQFFI